MRALTHIHTDHSWDSRGAVRRVAHALVADGVELALVSDHDDFGGSIEMRALIDAERLPLSVPIAAEIRTDHGDVIVVFEDGAPPAIESLKRWSDLWPIVRDRGGLIWLPHPYQSHDAIEELAAGSDVVEVFNARCSPDQNRRAAELCRRHGAVPGFGADVHRIGEIGRFGVEYVAGDSILDTLRTPAMCSAPVRTRTSDIMAAEIVNGVKRRRATLVGFFGLRWMKHRALEAAGRLPD